MHHNESLIGIVLHNLVDNAVKNTENGKITISATVENGRVALRIADTGKGMTAAQLQAYNDYFSQSQINRHLVNAGFGFQIIKEIAVLQKLQIQVASNHEKGLVFCVLIPETGYSSLSR
jgi:K+-sensing histidine kinase KdpD